MILVFSENKKMRLVYFAPLLFVTTSHALS